MESRIVRVSTANTLPDTPAAPAALPAATPSSDVYPQLSLSPAVPVPAPSFPPIIGPRLFAVSGATYLSRTHPCPGLPRRRSPHLGPGNPRHHKQKFTSDHMDTAANPGLYFAYVAFAYRSRRLTFVIPS